MDRREFLKGFFAGLVAVQVVQLPGPAPYGKLSDREKGRLIAEFIKTPQGRIGIARSMMQPLRVRRDYQAIGRKAFPVQELPQGSLPVYDRNPDVAAGVVGDEGENDLWGNPVDPEFYETMRQAYSDVGRKLADDSDAVDRIIEHMDLEEVWRRRQIRRNPHPLSLRERAVRAISRLFA